MAVDTISGISVLGTASNSTAPIADPTSVSGMRIGRGRRLREPVERNGNVPPGVKERVPELVEG